MKSDEKELVERIRNVQNGVMERIVPEEENYKTYQEHIHRYIFASNFCKDKIVLDVACGAGYGSHYLMKNSAKSVIGVDISEDAIAYAKTHYTNQKIEFIVGDGTKLPFSANSLEVIVSFETIEHITEYEKYLSECKRVLTKGGVFICSTPNKMCENISDQYHIREFYLDEFYEMMNENFREAELYAQGYFSIIVTIGGKLLSVFPKERKVKDLIKRTIWRKRYASIPKYYNLTPSNDQSYQVSSFKKVLFMRPRIIISVAKK